MTIVVNDQVHLSEFQASDKDTLVSHLNDRDIYDRTLRIPFPYTDANADEWLALVANLTKQQGQPVHWAIRFADDALIGGCGFENVQVGKSHRTEVGYWLAKPFWNSGIMTAVVQRVCQHAFEEFGLVKIAAHVFCLRPADHVCNLAAALGIVEDFRAAAGIGCQGGRRRARVGVTVARGRVR